MLKEWIHEPEKTFSGDVKPWVEVYRLGDEKALAEMTENSPLFDLCFLERNEKWMAHVLPELDRDGVSFISGGAGHFVPELCRYRRLKKEGYTITRAPRAPLTLANW